MNTKLIAIIVAAVVIIGGGIYLGTKKTNNSNTSSNSSQRSGSSSSSFATKKACDLFTLADAKQIIGSSAATGSVSGLGDTTANGVSVSTCVYTNGATDTSSLDTATVLVRGGLDSAGVASNKAGFSGDASSNKTTAISNLGDAAHFNSDLGQVDVLKGSYWIIVTSGGVGGANYSQSQETQIAQMMLAKL